MHSLGTHLTHFEMKLHSSEAADLERSCMLHVYYRIALNFQGSKFSRMATFEDFVEIIS